MTRNVPARSSPGRRPVTVARRGQKLNYLGARARRQTDRWPSLAVAGVVHDRRLRRILGFLEDEMAAAACAAGLAGRGIMRNHRRARSDHRRGISQNPRHVRAADTRAR